MKQALVTASYGTSVPEACGGIEAVERAREDAAAGYIAVRAFTSPAVRRILAAHGEQVPGLAEVLEVLCGEGVDRVVVQPTLLLDGRGYSRLKAEAEGFSGRFAQIIVGRPLLADGRDVLRFAQELAGTHPWRDREAVVYLGHGTEGAASEVYTALQSALELAGRGDIRIGVVKGRPGLEDVLRLLPESGGVTLLPLLLAAGNHARNDMAVDWKNRLEQAGHPVRCRFTGLGELAWVQEMYRERLLDVL